MALTDILSGLTGGPGSPTEMPGTLNQGWDYYFQWAEKDHGAWSSAFEQAETNRRNEDKLWREYFKKVYSSDMGFYKKVTMFALNSIQLWALQKQYKQQKEISDRTYEIADRVQTIAEELFSYYNKVYQPHETALSKQINTYFSGGGACINYSDTAERFESNVRRAFARAKADALRCTSSFCGGLTAEQLRQWEGETAQAVSNARTGAFRYEELRKETRDTMYLEFRMKFMQVGRNVAAQGQGGIMRAFESFSSFGADPGAAMSQLLGTLANTVGQMISSPISPSGNLPTAAGAQAMPYDVFLHRTRQSGDLQPAKAAKVTRQG